MELAFTPEQQELVRTVRAFTKKELAPQEDRGFIVAVTSGAPNASLEQALQSTEQLTGLLASFWDWTRESRAYRLLADDGVSSSGEVVFDGQTHRPVKWIKRFVTLTSDELVVALDAAGLPARFYLNGGEDFYLERIYREFRERWLVLVDAGYRHDAKREDRRHREQGHPASVRGRPGSDRRQHGAGSQRERSRALHARLREEVDQK